MRYVKVRAKVSNVERESSEEIELIADTGAIYTAIPEDILMDLGVVARGKRRFKTASGELKELPVGEAYIEIAGEGSLQLLHSFQEVQHHFLASQRLNYLAYRLIR